MNTNPPTQPDIDEDSAEIIDPRVTTLDLLELLNMVGSKMAILDSQIKGLQAENRHILERLERHMGDAHGGQQ